jgi:hypothetical protein
MAAARVVSVMSVRVNVKVVSHGHMRDSVCIRRALLGFYPDVH